MLLLPYQNAGVSIMLLAEDFMTKDLLIGVIFFFRVHKDVENNRDGSNTFVNI